MRIVHVYPRLTRDRGGPYRVVLDLAEAQARRGHDVVVLTGATDVDDPVGAFEVVCHGDLRGGRGRRAARAVLESADVAHLRAVWNLQTAAVARACRRADVPYVLTLDGMLDRWSMAQSPRRKRLYLAVRGRALVAGAGAVHATARAERRQAEEVLGSGVPWVTIPNLVDLRQLAAATPTAAVDEFGLEGRDGPVLLFLSRIHPKKGLDVLLRALDRHRERPWHLVVAGDGEPAHVATARGLVAELALGGRVTFTGFVTGTLRDSLFAAADLLVLPTRQENFGLVFYEALAAGTHVVTTRGVDTWEELSRSGNATIVDAAEDVDDVLGPLLSDGHAGSAEAGRRWVTETLDPAAILDAWDRVLEDVAGAAPAR